MFISETLSSVFEVSMETQNSLPTWLLLLKGTMQMRTRRYDCSMICNEGNGGGLPRYVIYT